MNEKPEKVLHKAATWADGYLTALDPKARARLLQAIGRNLRRATVRRMAAQQAPDGTPWEGRKATLRGKSGRIRGKMFRSLRKAKFLKVTANARGIELGFSGRTGTIARTHHYGLRDRLRVGNGKSILVKYAARPLLGLSQGDEEAVRDIILEHMNRPT